MVNGFYQRLVRSWEIRRSLLCVGLDPDMDRLPARITGHRFPLLEFNRHIVDATGAHACAFKLQIAYYAAVGAERQLEQTVAHIRDAFPDMPVILDAKRGDIGATARMYAKEAFERYGVDAVTVNPYMGSDTVAPFADYGDRGVILICRTSNPGSRDFQELESGDCRIYQHVARRAARDWNANRNLALVVGAQYPGSLSRVRGIAGDMPLLVPGIGTQGGNLEAVLEHGLDSRGAGLMINVSRDILYAGTQGDFAESASRKAESYRERINAARIQTA